MLKRTSRSAWTSSRSVQASRIASSWRNKAPSSASGRSNTNSSPPSRANVAGSGNFSLASFADSHRTISPVACPNVPLMPLTHPHQWTPAPSPPFPAPGAARRQHLAEVAAVSKGHKRINIGKLTQHTRVLLLAAEHDMTLSMARSSAISSCPLTAMEDSASPSATRYADSVVSRGGAHLLHPVPPPRAMGNTAAMEVSSAFIWVTADRLSTSIS